MPGNILSMHLYANRFHNNLNEKMPKPVQTCWRGVVMHHLTLKSAKALHAVESIISVFIPHSSSKPETYVLMNLCQVNHLSLLYQKCNTYFLTTCHCSNLLTKDMINHTQGKLMLFCKLLC